MAITRKTYPGFTIVELTIALTFIAILLLFIVTITMQATAAFNKGLALKSINQASRTIVDQISNDIAASATVHQQSIGTTGGVLCTDAAVYYWNTIPSLESPSSYWAIKYKAPHIEDKVYLVRTTNAQCPPASATTWDVLDYPGTGATNKTSELLGGFSGVIDIKVDDTQKPLFRISVVLGTTKTDMYETPALNACAPGRLGEFCARTDFTRIVYAPRAS
ncbi:MAG: PilW family protein [Acidobacteriota bacterium]